MKKILTNTKLALFASAAALAALAPQAHAQASDALLDKLVDKGILTVDEAKDLRVETDKDFKTAFQAKTGMPDWVSGYKFSGDVRGRFEQFSGDNSALIDRTRLRYRVRLGVAVNMLENVEAGFRLSSADSKGIGSQASAGNSVSGNSTMQDNFSKKGIYVDAAYGKWTPINSGGWLLSATVGKMDNPFNFTPMVFDPDITPEGAALTGGYTINDKHSLAFTGAAFVMDEESGTTHDPMMYGGQATWNAKWNDKWSSSLGVGALAIMSPNQLGINNVPYVNQGNTRVNTTNNSSSDILKYNYTPLIADASVTYTFDNGPFLYTGAFPIKLAAEFMNNPGAPNNNNAYWVGLTFGKSGTRKTWDLTYRYEYLEADAWYDQMVDDDFGAYYSSENTPNNPSLGLKGYVGGTNVRGHLIKGVYSFTDSLSFTASAFLDDLINQTGESKSGSVHFMADLMWKF
jgi:Putative porin